MGINTPKNNRIDQTTSEQTLIDGFHKHAAEIPLMVISGSAETTADIIATLQSRVDTAKAVMSSRATWQMAIRTEQVKRDTSKTYLSGVKQALLVAFAGQIDALADFGLTARVQHVPTPDEKVAAAEKATVSVASACGHRIEGLTLHAAIAVLRALG